MKNFAIYISNKMASKKWIEQDQKNYFRFAIEVILSHAITFSSIIIIGFILNKFFETIIFLMLFCSLRTYSDGYHAKKFMGCYFLTNLSFIVCVYSPIIYNSYIELIMFFVFIILLVLEGYRCVTNKISLNIKYIILMTICSFILVISKLLQFGLYPIILSILVIVVLANFYKEQLNVKKKYIYQ